ncbi:Modification methylase PaeR7I [Sporotomaculum syntrophicum]|uniref:site-specific DNA-methyltransferase (adenine-specific) n=1 Tax=Sporotomaculum syntrophicum TaxID=182264 RepID=A0A9D3AYK3_9FIRM|nr:N-6 DNA methylase [Sporotomaculum syntrophicum]KAF1086172.1 Modification methylase PaeR7I [Sporotomaculum syntrophicum]
MMGTDMTYPVLPNGRYNTITHEKAIGATYTPKILADFVAKKILETTQCLSLKNKIRILDPAVGSGELLNSILELLTQKDILQIEVVGFETNQMALNFTMDRLQRKFPNIDLHLYTEDFLEFVLKRYEKMDQHSSSDEGYDLIIANPPYVRTQILGANQSRLLAQHFKLSGRVDLYHAFIVGISQVLKAQGVAGIIVSNRFMTTKSGAFVRQLIRDRFNIRYIWDLGDTKIFNAAVLPSVLLLEGCNSQLVSEKPGFTSIYETNSTSESYAQNPVEALSMEGHVKLEDGRCFLVQHGYLNISGPRDAVWRIATKTSDSWLATVNAHTWNTFQDIGKIRVGVKTCADKVFIRSDWQHFFNNERPELLRPLTNHYIARRFKALELGNKSYQILYPHEVVNGKRQAVDLSFYKRDRIYLEMHRAVLEERKYVTDTGRKWYEIWVPHDPSAWNNIKLVFRDISEKPTFWIDQSGSVVNGDCYWLISKKSDQTDLLWLAVAVGNSTFIETFYDYRFNNKLYAKRRRFITQYVNEFPLPDPKSPTGIAIIEMAKEIYNCIGTQKADILAKELDRLVWVAFGLR